MKVTLTKLGDLLTIAIPSVTLAMAFFISINDALKFALAYGLANLACFLIKGFTYANRPRAGGTRKIKWFDWSFDEGNSFPSGHTTSAMTGAVYAILLSPAMGAVLLALAFLCAYSRIKARAHFLRDVFFGAVIAQAFCGVIYFDIFNLI